MPFGLFGHSQPLANEAKPVRPVYEALAFLNLLAALIGVFTKLLNSRHGSPPGSLHGHPIY